MRQSSRAQACSTVVSVKKSTTVLYHSLYYCSRVTLKYIADEICSSLHAQSNDLVGFSADGNEIGETCRKLPREFH